MTAWVVTLALIWVALQGTPSLANLLGGLFLGVVVLWFFRSLADGKPARWRLGKAVALLAFFLKELVVTNLQVLRECFRPQPRIHPAILRVPLEAETDNQIVTLANLVTLTPSTLSLHVSEDRRTLYVHSLFGEESNREAVREGIKTMERKVMEAQG